MFGYLKKASVGLSACAGGEAVMLKASVQNIEGTAGSGSKPKVVHTESKIEMTMPEKLEKKKKMLEEEKFKLREQISTLKKALKELKVVEGGIESPEYQDHEEQLTIKRYEMECYYKDVEIYNIKMEINKFVGEGGWEIEAIREKFGNTIPSRLEELIHNLDIANKNLDKMKNESDLDRMTILVDQKRWNMKRKQDQLTLQRQGLVRKARPNPDQANVDEYTKVHRLLKENHDLTRRALDGTILESERR